MEFIYTFGSDLRAVESQPFQAGQPLEMFETTLAACRAIRYPHTTYLLDDTQDPRFREMAERHGAVHMELVGLPAAKAGKINAAMARTTEDFVLVLDPDHIPFPSSFTGFWGISTIRRWGSLVPRLRTCSRAGGNRTSVTRSTCTAWCRRRSARSTSRYQHPRCGSEMLSGCPRHKWQARDRSCAQNRQQDSGR